MSRWTTVVGIIQVNLPHNMQSLKSAENYVKWAIDEVQRRGTRVTGSEGDLIFYVNARPDEYEFDGNIVERNTVLITVYKSLRDRDGARTSDEVEKFLHRLNHFVQFDSVGLEISYYGFNRSITEGPYDDILTYSQYSKEAAKLFDIIEANYVRYMKSHT